MNVEDQHIAHYAETFIIPANVKSYILRTLVPNEKIGVIRIYAKLYY